MSHLMILHPFDKSECNWSNMVHPSLSFSCFLVRLVLPSSSQKWQKNLIDIKMYLGGLVQVCSGFLTLIPASCFPVR